MQRDGTSDGDINGDGNFFGGGAVRSVLRGLKWTQLFFRAETLGSLPRRVPTKLIAKSADRLSQIVDIRDHYNASSEIYKPNDNLIGKRSIFRKLMNYKNMLLIAMPSVIKSAILGSALFWLHDESVVFQKRIICNEKGSITPEITAAATPPGVFGDFRSLYVLAPAVMAINGGIVGGSAHGTLYVIWDYGHNKIQNIAAARPYLRRLLPKRTDAAFVSVGSLAGTALSHCFVHACLFGTYELVKWMGLYGIAWSRTLNHQGELHVVHSSRDPNNDNTSTPSIHVPVVPVEEDASTIEGAAVVCVAASCAALVAEGVGNLTLTLEEEGVIAGVRILSQKPRAQWWAVAFPTKSPRVLAAISFPTVLGFFAYEYGKEMYTE
mmetsp:Transcript_10881/g.17715  ORF Transcript_10881/g.17715 Transcript_10881/m.17715 type:complete len:380 (+) Transcript_10881:86-1225(+)